MKYIPSSSYVAQGAPSAIPKMVQKKRTFHIFGFIASIMLIASLLSAVGVFLYKQELMKKLDTAKAELLKQSTTDNENKIAEIGSFDLKLKTAEMLLENHQAPSKLFQELELLTKKTVQLSTLKYTYDPGFESTLEIEGNTDELASVALQKRKIIEENLFSVLSVQGITTDVQTPDSEEEEESDDIAEGKVKFAVKGLLKDEVIAYEEKSVGSVSSSLVSDAKDARGTNTSQNASSTESNEVIP